MLTFSGQPSELNEEIVYERDALKFVRLELFNQRSSTDGGRFELDLSKPKNAEGHFLGTHHLTVDANFSGEAVKSALSRLRPLVFSATFKMHDMIVAWVLRANNFYRWSFREKIDFLKYKLDEGDLTLPPVLDSWTGATGFWKLYEVLADYRNELTHGGSFRLEGNVLIFTPKERKGKLLKPLELSDVAQGAYARLVDFVADHALKEQQFEPVEALIAENDLYELRVAHRLTKFTRQNVRRSSVHAIHAPATHDGGVVVDFDDIKASVERVLPVTGGGVLAYDLTLSTDIGGRRLEWWFPELGVPAGEVTLREGDANFYRAEHIP